MTESDEPKEITVSKGQHFKDRFGYSITMAKNMKKHGCKTPDQYRAIRKARKLSELEAKRAKHKKARIGRLSKPTPVQGKKK